jgi:nucleoside-diphosphate-sugar epimerase
MKKKLLICGATGFIGRNCVEFFSKNKNYKIFATYNNRKPYKINGVNWIKSDLRDVSKVDKITKGMNIVIQAAATSTGSKVIINQPFLHVTDNVVMNAYIFRSCYLNKVNHVIFFSCTTMYKSSKEPIVENNFDPRKDINSKYFGVANTKIYNEKMCEFYSRLGSTKFTAIRHSNIYGPYDKFDLETSHVFGATIAKVMMAKNKIKVWGKGKEKRDLLHVNDLIDFISKVIVRQKNKFELLNCGSGHAISVLDLVKKIIKYSGKKVRIEFDSTKPNIPTYLSVNCNKAKKLLGWKPKVKIDIGIKKTFQWRSENFLNK